MLIHVYACLHTLLLTVGEGITNQQHYDPLFIMFASEFLFTVQTISSSSSILSVFFYNHRIWKSDSIMTPFCGYVRRPGQKTLGLVVTWQLSYVCCTVNISCWFNIKWLKQTWASFSVLTAEPKGQEIITQKTFLAKVTLIENYINHLEGKKFQLMPSVCGITSVSVSVLDF